MVASIGIDFIPSFAYLLTKRTEDCIECFNKFTSRYSNFQYAEYEKLAWERSKKVQTAKELNPLKQQMLAGSAVNSSKFIEFQEETAHGPKTSVSAVDSVPRMS